ncbi:MAG: homoserine dehydrogenase [Halanaerobiales bacterium]|nr:homoserine dehydrogenase [Halanaerobiales bacterium]
MIKIGLLGFGTVGSGVYEIIEKEKNNFRTLLGEEIEISKILVSDLNKKRNVNLPPTLITDNPYEILNAPDIDIIVEAIGGVKHAYKYVTLALENDKHVVTANKAIVAKYMDELLALAEKKGKGFLFEASVGGGIPIIKSLKQNIRINKITQIKGILNGTTNFILSKMTDENLSFNEALELARKLGYAEADPTDDIEGYDVARKLSILSSIAFKTKTNYNNIMCRGINSISKLDISMFKKLSLKVKLIGNAVISDNFFIDKEFSASVEPILVNENSTFASVNDAFNIVSLMGDTVGEQHFYGHGAGKNSTANAVVSDILDLISGEYKFSKLIENTITIPAGVKLFKGKYYLRVAPASKTQIPKIFNLLNKNDIKYEIISINEDLILLTELISADTMEHFIKQLKLSHDNYCYLRIEGKIESKKYAEVLS